MKSHQFLIAAVWLGFGFCGDFSPTANAATTTGFEIPWWTVDGGCGGSSGGGFEVTGTIAQPDAAPTLANGCWSVEPGFWGVDAAVTTPGAPVLRVSRFNPTVVRVAFTPGCGDWVLQWTATLEEDASPTNWTDDDEGSLISVGDELVRDFHVPSWGPRLFFRLREP